MPNLPFIRVLYHYRSKNPKLFTFATRFATLFLVYKVYFYFANRDMYAVYDFHQVLSLKIIAFIHLLASGMLGLFGYETTIEGILLKINGTIGVRIAGGCIGFGIMSLFAGLIISYPGHLKVKYYYIPIGILLIIVMNSLRIALLAYLVQYSYTIWELNHKLIFKVFIYSFIFLLWVFWIKKTTMIEKSQDITT